MHSKLSLFAAVAVLLTAFSPAASRPRPRSLTILYFNDLHGHLEPWKLNPGDARTVGGIVRIAALATRIERENRAGGRATVFLEAGDIFQGTPLSTIFRGQAEVAALNGSGVDAMAVGNHEFDFGLDALQRASNAARFPVLSANIVRSGRGARAAVAFARPYAVLTPAPGLRVGVIGLTTTETPSQTFPSNVAGLRFVDPILAARPVARALDRTCDVVVALSHLGVEEDRRLAREVPAIDVIVGGHNHILLSPAAREGKTVITQAKEYGLYLGRLDLVIDAGHVEVTRDELIAIDDRLPADPAVEAIVRSFKDRLDRRLDVVVGRASVRLEGDRSQARTRETTLGNLVTDLMREASRADVALLNGGGIRASIGPGPVTLATVLTAFPFDNQVVVVSLPGSTLREALGRSAALPSAALPGGFLQVSGLTYVVEGGRATDIRVGGQPLEDSRAYTVAMTDFTAQGGDGYDIFPRTAIGSTATGLLLNGLVIDRFRKGGEVTAAVEGRIVRKD